MKIEFHFFIALFIACVTIFNDILVYMIKIDYGISILVSTIVIIYIYIILFRKKIIKLSINIKKYDFFIYIFFLAYIISKGIMNEDKEFDTLVYHIYLQTHPFLDKVNFDFFPGRIFCIFLFPLGDRMNYIFRYILGYRVGTLFSYYIIIILFYQIKKIIFSFCNKEKLASVFSLLFLFITSITSYFGTYYIDNLGLIFLLEIFYIIFTQKDLLLKREKLFLIAFYMGISLGIKISNVFFVFLLLIFLLYFNYKDFKKLNLKNIIICFIFAILPYLIYLIDNYKQTGSILFPYYNEILQSTYFDKYNWVEPRFGIEGIINKIFWPIITSCFGKPYGDERLVYDHIWGFGYIFSYICLIVCFIKKNYGKIFTLTIFTLMSTYIWIKFLYGYMRYGIFIPVLYCILISIVLIKCIKKVSLFNKVKKFEKLFFSISMIFSIVIASIYTYNMFGIFDKKSCRLLFKDRENEKNNIKIDGIWGTLEDIGCYTAVLVREKNVPIINLKKEYFEGSEEALNKYNELIKNNDIYVIVDGYKYNIFEELIEKYNLKIDTIVEELNANNNPFIEVGCSWKIVKLKYVE